jgi:ABC-type lipoprotein release transport system permease subunit
MSKLRLILASLFFHRRAHAAAGLGVIAGTAVLTGALLVGDSVRGSLRHLALDRLGWIDEVLVVDRFFRAALADEIQDGGRPVVPAIVLRGTVNAAAGGTANGVGLYGIDDRFWELWPQAAATAPLKAGDVLLNRPLADELHLAVGDEVIVRLPTASQVPRESLLGRKSETVTSRRLRVGGILPAGGAGSFSLNPTQQAAFNAFLRLNEVQDILDESGRVNALFVGWDEGGAAPTPADHARLQAALHPKLEDYGLSVRDTKRDYINLSTKRMVIDPPAARDAMQALKGYGPQPALTYLANTLACGKKSIPYSTVTAIDFGNRPPLGPIHDADGKPIGPIADGEIVLNRWAADKLEAKPGDEIQMTFFDPESTHGIARERTVSMRLKAIAAIAGPADDRNLTPELKGVTDKLSMAAWNPPFPFDDRRVGSDDEAYWKKYGATPKAFVSLAEGRKLWASRFGDTTSIRIAPSPEADEVTIRELWRPDPVQMGFEFRPVRRLALQAASGTTPFNALFLGFSFFLIASAVMLVAVLFRLGTERRADEIGLLLAVGLGAKAVRRLLLAEGFGLAAIAGLLGAAAGIGYAWLMIEGLRTWWLPAIGTPFLELHVGWVSLLVGYGLGVLVSLGAIAWSVGRMRHVSIRGLLGGQIDEARGPRRGRLRASLITAIVALCLAAITTWFGSGLSGMPQAGAFFGAGTLALVASMAAVWNRLASGSTGSIVSSGHLALARWALRNGARNPGRSTLTIGLVAAASFLLVAISAFHLDPPRGDRRDTGTGGFALVGQSDQPILQDLNTRAGRDEFGFLPDDEPRLDAAKIFECRLNAGDDASCLNLYQPRQPQVLGVGRDFIDRGGWILNTPNGDSIDNPWWMLDVKPGEHDGRPIVPIILDAATAAYSLHLSGVGARYSIDDAQGRPVELKVVGLLENSMLQGMIVMREEDFVHLYPDAAGYRFFLIDTPPDNRRPLESVLERGLSDQGFAVQTADDRLAGLLAVQNTYLLTFQSLGGLGLLLGTCGLAAVQLRNVLERRKELALLRACGFRGRLLAGLVLGESAALLLIGLAAGVVTALLAIAPQLAAGGAAIAWGTLGAILALVLVTGLLTSLFAVRAMLVAPLLPALRGE